MKSNDESIEKIACLHYIEKIVEKYLTAIRLEETFEIVLIISLSIFIFTANWYQQNDLYLLCGNSSGSTKCPDGYVCWEDRGKR